MRDGLLVALILILLSLSMYGQRVNYSSFVVEYSDSLRIPLSVVWNLSSSDIGKVKRKPSMKFYVDDTLNVAQVTPDNYTRSGYDRGHMCPAADRSISEKLMRETFVMTNITPQAPKLNRGSWKWLEDACRRLATGGLKLKIEAFSVFWKAPVYKIGRDSVAVPHGFIKNVRLKQNDSIIFTKYFPNL